eukprot:352915-Chlamydomonas_euryale.AAC.9
MREWIAGNATPSPRPSATRDASSGPVPIAAAVGIAAVKSDQSEMPVVSTVLPPKRSASAPPRSCVAA